MSLPVNNDEKILLVQGFLTATKGWNILKKMNIPDSQKVVLKHIMVHYKKQLIDLNLNIKNLVNLGKDYLSEKDQ